MNTKVRKLSTCHKMHHPRTNIESLSAKKETCDRGLIQLELTYETIARILRHYKRLNATVSKYTREAKEKIFIKESNKFAKQRDLKPKEKT